MVSGASRSLIRPNSFSLLRTTATNVTPLFTGKASDDFVKRIPGLLCPSLHFQRRTFCNANATNNEEALSRAAAADADSGSPTIFDKIIAKEVPSTIVYEDDKVLAFRDINPQAPVHVVVIPKIRDGLTQLGKAEARHTVILGHLLHAAKLVAEKEGIVDGFRVVINNGPTACQSVYHLHLHILGGRQMRWPPG